MSLYDTLDVGQDATPADIRAAYRRKAKAAHPDAGGTAEEFQAVALAHQVLSDSERRQRYDETGQVDDKPDNDEADAMAIIAAMVEHALNKEDLKHFDLVRDIRDQIKSEIGTAQDSLMEAQKFIDRAHDARKRAKVKKAGKRNLLAGMIDHRVGQAQQAMATLDRQIKLRERALVLLEDSEFEVEPRVMQPCPPISQSELQDLIRRQHEKNMWRGWGNSL